jgi:phasin family protein
MTNPAVDNLSKAGAEGLAKGAAAISEAGHTSLAAFQQLAEAYQQMASKNSTRLTESMKELGTIKSPVEFIALQQKLVKEAFENALADSKHIADVTVTVFKAAFAPIEQKITAAQHALHK